MQFITFVLLYPFIWILSRLPMRLLYIKSDVFFFIIYYIIGYRKKVVKNNIKLAFPEKNDAEVNTLTKKFFKHLVDLIFESVKAFSISEKELKKRYVYKNPEVINSIAIKGKSIILTGSHQANWELAFGMSFFLNINCFGAYTKIKNKYFEKFIKDTRTRFGCDGEATTKFKTVIEDRYINNIQSLYILLSDQSPQVFKTKYWANFLNNFVPIHTGAESLAKKYNFSVINMNITKLKRGYYEAEFELIAENPREFNNFEITDKYLEITEAHIKRQPEFYLWSHKRFKHKGKYDQWLEMKKSNK